MSPETTNRLGGSNHFSKGLQDWRLRIGSHGVDAKQSPYAASRAFVGATVRGKSYHLAGKDWLVEVLPI